MKQQIKTKTVHDNNPMPSKDTCKLLALLAGFMLLMGIPWIILIIKSDTNIHAAFAIQLLFVFFVSFQGFFLFVFFAVLDRDAHNLWFKFLSLKVKNPILSKNPLTSRNTAKSADTIKDAAIKNQENFTMVNYSASYNDAQINAASGEADSIKNACCSSSKTEPQVLIKSSTTEFEIVEVTFNESGRESEETSL